MLVSFLSYLGKKIPFATEYKVRCEYRYTSYVTAIIILQD